MAIFEQAIQYVLDNEGGDSNDAADHGGRTRFGITEKEAKAHGIDIEKLTLDQAKAIYKSDYWKFDGIASQRIATKLLDMAVNLGPGTAAKLAQRVAGTVVDGVIGLATIRAINYCTPGEAGEFISLLKLACACADRYATIVADDHTQVTFLRGWMERALRLP